MVAYFEYESEKERAFANDRLRAACNYELNVNQLEHDKDFQTIFKTLFRKGKPKANA